MAEGVATVDSLPWKMLVKVLSYLDTHDLVETVPHVCQRWREASMETQLWINRPFCPDEYYSCKEILHCLKKMPELRHVKLFLPQYLSIAPFPHYQDNVFIDDILQVLCKYCPKVESFAFDDRLRVSIEKIRTFITHSAKLSSFAVRYLRGVDWGLTVLRGLINFKDLSLEFPLLGDSLDVESLKQLLKFASRPKSLHFFGNLEHVGNLSDVLSTTSHVLTGMCLDIGFVSDVNIVNVFKELLNSFHSLRNLQLEADCSVNRAFLLKFLHVVRHVLTELDITNYKVEKDEECVEWGNVLSECHQLQSLKLEGSNALLNLGQLPSVTSLSLCLKNTPDNVLLNLFLHGSWQQLKTLHMVGISCSDDDTWRQIFTCCPNLQHINLTGSDLSQDCVGNLVRYCPSVRELILTETNVSNFMLRDLYKLRGLELLCLKKCLQLTKFDVGNIIKCANVKILNLNYCSRFEDSAVINILDIGNLEVLSILHIGAARKFFSSVKIVSKRLRKICVCRCDYNEGEPVCKALEHVKFTTLPCRSKEISRMSDDFLQAVMNMHRSV